MSSNSTFAVAPPSRSRGFLHELLTWIKWLSISTGVWFALGILSVVQQRRLDAMLGRSVMAWSFYAHIALINIWIYVVLGPLIVIYTWKIHSAFKNKGAIALLHLLGFFSYVNLHALLRFVFAVMHDPRTGEIAPRTFALYRQTFIFFFNDDIYMYLTFAAGAFGYHYYREIRDRELAESRLQAQLSTAQLQILKMQLQPHFLFNTLHAISTLVTMDPKRAKKMIVLLSELLRVAIDYGVTQEVPLKDEVDFVSKYLDIEKMRFEEDLATHFEVDPQTLDALVPNLLLQPLVENAVKHGVRILPGQGHIHVGAKRDGNWLIMHVRDNGPGMVEQTAENSDGLGLRITRARLEQLYGSSHAFSIQNLPTGGVDIHIRIPFRTVVLEEAGVHA
jgi:signal transduction histidine kinase